MALDYCPQCNRKLGPPLKSSGRQVCAQCGWSDKPRRAIAPTTGAAPSTIIPPPARSAISLNRANPASSTLATAASAGQSLPPSVQSAPTAPTTARDQTTQPVQDTQGAQATQKSQPTQDLSPMEIQKILNQASSEAFHNMRPRRQQMNPPKKRWFGLWGG